MPPFSLNKFSTDIDHETTPHYPFRY